MFLSFIKSTQKILFNGIKRCGNPTEGENIRIIPAAWGNHDKKKKTLSNNP